MFFGVFAIFRGYYSVGQQAQETEVSLSVVPRSRCPSSIFHLPTTTLDVSI